MTDIASYAAQKSDICRENNRIPEKYFRQYGIDIGLRDSRGIGMFTGLTRISKLSAFDIKDGCIVPKYGKLWFRGIPLEDIVENYPTYGFGRTAYLLLFGEMPDNDGLKEFNKLLNERMFLTDDFVRDCIIKHPTRDIMNSMTRGCLALGTHLDEEKAMNLETNIAQSIGLIAVFPMMAIYSMHSYNYAFGRGSMYIHKPLSGLSVTENILRMLRPDANFTALEAKVLDAVLIAHMEHGAGTNSTFTVRVVSSTGADIYAAMSAGMSSLKGTRHGGANVKCRRMMSDMRKYVSENNDPAEIKRYLGKVLDKEAFDRMGLIYGMGHAVYTLSDPRSELIKKYARMLAEEKGRLNEFDLYEKTAATAPQMIMQRKNTRKPICTNIDFYSGLIYDMLGIPEELYAPMIAMARIVGWCAHRIELLSGKNKVVRPLYKNVMKSMNQN